MIMSTYVIYDYDKLYEAIELCMYRHSVYVLSEHAARLDVPSVNEEDKNMYSATKWNIQYANS